jgi:regulator of cell morphogenesis and NO signaling
MDFTSDSIISDIVRYDYRAADVFKNHNINFCCSGKISLDDACTSRAIETTSILNELKEATRDIHLPNNLRFDQWNTDFLVDYISNVHHAWLFGEMPSLQGRLLSFMDGHRKKYPELVKIHAVFQNYARHWMLTTNGRKKLFSLISNRLLQLTGAKSLTEACSSEHYVNH